MSLPPEVAAAAEAALSEFCEHHSSAAIADRLRYTYKITGTTAFLIEQRPGFMNAAEWSSVPVAKFKFSAARNDWSLYWSESGDRWRRLSSAKADSDLRKLIKLVADDAYGVFTKG
jgi:hypothetical protein